MNSICPEIPVFLTKYFYSHQKTQEEWRTVFYVCGGFTLLGTLVFGTMASGELEPWAVEDDVTEVTKHNGGQQETSEENKGLDNGGFSEIDIGLSGGNDGQSSEVNSNDDSPK